MHEPVLEKQWVGIDVSKRSFKVYVRPLGLRFQMANREAGLGELLSWGILPTATISGV
jgi:transposase